MVTRRFRNVALQPFFSIRFIQESHSISVDTSCICPSCRKSSTPNLIPPSRSTRTKQNFPLPVRFTGRNSVFTRVLPSRGGFAFLLVRSLAEILVSARDVLPLLKRTNVARCDKRFAGPLDASWNYHGVKEQAPFQPACFTISMISINIGATLVYLATERCAPLAEWSTALRPFAAFNAPGECSWFGETLSNARVSRCTRDCASTSLKRAWNSELAANVGPTSVDQPCRDFQECFEARGIFSAGCKTF